MTPSRTHRRRIAYAMVAAVWLFAAAVGLSIGLDLGHAAFG